MKTYVLRITDAPPRLTQVTVTIQAESYQDAVRQLHDEWRDAGRSISLHSNAHDPYCWHWISRSGATTDQNRGSGVPEHEQLTRDQKETRP
jgi:hypothetical protein